MSIQLVTASGGSGVDAGAGGAFGAAAVAGGGVGCGDLAPVEEEDAVGLGVGIVTGAVTVKVPMSPLMSTV